MQDNTYKEMFMGEDGKTKIRPAIVRRNEDEDKIETIYLIRDGYNNFFNHEPDIVTNALEFHVNYNKNTGRSTGTLYYDAYDMDYTRRIGAEVQAPHSRHFEQVHEGYECTNLRRYKIQFFPPEINNIDALNKYLEHRLDAGLFQFYLIDTIEMEGLKQTLREQFELDQNTEILIRVFIRSTDNFMDDIFDDDIPDDYVTHDYNFGAASFNNRFVLFKEFFFNGGLELLECRPTREIRTRDDFDDFADECSDADPDVDFYDEEDVRENAARFIDNPELFIQAEEGEIIELDTDYKEALSESNRERSDPVIDNLICKKLELLALQGYKHFIGKDIGFRYKCIDGLKIQHNTQDKQRIDLTTAKRLQFFRKKQEEQQLNHIQNAGNEMFANERLHD